MKRLHVNLSVQNLNQSIGFYKALFNAEPTVTKPDYAKWMLEDPKVNFSISLGENRPTGIEHLGIQAESESELNELFENVSKAEGEKFNEGDTVCCYAQSNKTWIKDPQGIEWEMFHTYGESDVNKVGNAPCCADTCCAS